MCQPCEGVEYQRQGSGWPPRRLTAPPPRRLRGPLPAKVRGRAGRGVCGPPLHSGALSYQPPSPGGRARSVFCLCHPPPQAHPCARSCPPLLPRLSPPASAIGHFPDVARGTEGGGMDGKRTVRTHSLVQERLSETDFPKDSRGPKHLRPSSIGRMD